MKKPKSNKKEKSKDAGVTPVTPVTNGNDIFVIDSSSQSRDSSIIDSISSVDSYEYEYAWCCIRPKCCSKCTNWVYIYIILNIVCFFQNLICGGISTIILSTLAKEFYLSSFESGLFLAIYEISAFISSPIVGYIGGLKSVNKMRVLSISLIIITVGAYLIGALIFIKDPDPTIYSITNSDLCINENVTRVYKEFYNDCRESGSTFIENLKLKTVRNLHVLLYVGNGIIGFASISLYSVGIAYIEEISNPQKSDLCQAIFYATGAIGGGIGIIITGQFLNINSRFYVDSLKDQIALIKPSSFNWIGAWWLPWMIYGFFCFFLAIYIYGFPHKIRKNGDRNQSNQNGTTRNHDVQNKKGNVMSYFKGFLKSIKETMSNMRFLMVTLASATEGALFKGFLGFIPQFFEFQYQLTATYSSLITGAVALISVIFGSVLGAQLVSKLKWNAAKCSLFISILYFITSFAFWLLLLYCPELNFNKNNDIVSSFNSSLCLNCKCDNMFDPICAPKNEMFQSPCHAGCMSEVGDGVFSNCSCLNSITTSMSYSNCHQGVKCFDIMIAGIFVAFFIVFLTSVSLIPHLKTIICSVRIENQTFGLAIRAGITMVLGNFVGPIVFGIALDKACIYWKTNCFDQKVCKLYNNYEMSLYLAIIGFCFRFTSCIFTFIAYFLFKNYDKRQLDLQESGTVDTVETIVSELYRNTAGTTEL